MRAVPVELLLEVAAEPLQVGLQSSFGLVRQIRPRGAVRLPSRVEHRVHTHRSFTDGRGDRRIEIDIQRDRTAILSAETCELSQAIEADRRCRHTALSAWRGPILSLLWRNISGLRLVLYGDGDNAPDSDKE